MRTTRFGHQTPEQHQNERSFCHFLVVCRNYKLFRKQVHSRQEQKNTRLFTRRASLPYAKGELAVGKGQKGNSKCERYLRYILLSTKMLFVRVHRLKVKPECLVIDKLACTAVSLHIRHWQSRLPTILAPGICHGMKINEIQFKNFNHPTRGNCNYESEGNLNMEISTQQTFCFGPNTVFVPRYTSSLPCKHDPTMVRVFLIMSYHLSCGIHWQLLLIGSQFAIHKASRLHLQCSYVYLRYILLSTKMLFVRVHRLKVKPNA